jgi:hypothetical protein
MAPRFAPSIPVRRSKLVRASVRSILLAVGLAAVAALPPAPAVAAGNVGILILKEHGVGTKSAAQPYVDKLVAHTAKLNGWASAKGEYHPTRAAGEAFIKSDNPQFGILSLGAFLGLRGTYKLDPIGKVVSSATGGGQYFLISKNATKLDECKGKTLATDHWDDDKFIENVVAAKAFKKSEFTLVVTTRHAQAANKVINGDAECALIDDAQLASVKDPSVKAVWKSAKLESMVIVAFPNASAAERTSFQNNMPNTCTGDGAAHCNGIGLQALQAASASAFAQYTNAYP